MRQLERNELDEVSGGVAPLIAALMSPVSKGAIAVGVAAAATIGLAAGAYIAGGNANK